MPDDKDDLSTIEKVVEYLNEAAFQSSEKERVETLAKVQELVIHFDPTLLDSFFEEIVSFQTDRNGDVRKFVVSFIEEACKKDSAMLPRLVPNVEILLADETIAVVKRVVQAAAQLHKFSIAWISSAKQKTTEMEQTWEIINRIKNTIVTMIDHDNDGVRTQAIKFLESVIMVQTYTEPDSTQRPGEFTLDQVPLTLKIARPRKLEEEARMILGKLISFQGSLHISSVNLMTCMSSLSIVARARPTFMGKVVESLEILHANLPPTLTKSQVNSVRKHLKIQLLNLLRHTAAYDYHVNAVAILNDLGVTASEINKAMPSKDDIRRRIKRTKPLEEPSTDSPSKKRRLDKSSKKSDEGKEPSSEDTPVPENSTAVDITTRWLVERLNIESVANIVMLTMLNLPENMPPLFSVAYTPVTSAGSTTQVEHVGRLLASQMTAAGVGPGADRLAEEEKKDKPQSDDDSDENTDTITRGLIPTLVGGPPEPMEEDRLELMPAGFTRGSLWQKSKLVKLNDITKPLHPEAKQIMQVALLKKILGGSSSHRLYGAAQRARLRILARFSMFSSIEENFELEEFIFKDLAANMDLLQSWLFSQHASAHDFSQLNSVFSTYSNTSASYETLLKAIVTRIIRMTANKERNDLLSRILLEAPSVPSSVLQLLTMCFTQGEEASKDVSYILKDIAVWRPCHSKEAVKLLCFMAKHNDPLVRDVIESAIVELHSQENFHKLIGDMTQKQLFCLSEATPPEELFHESLSREIPSDEWTEDLIRACLFLPFALLPHQQELIHDLATVYVKAVNDAKRTILRLLENPVSHMGMDSPMLLSLVEECPKGSETLITRIIHVLTEKAPPSEELVRHVRELYNKRVSDVRFLIPVLTGLSKKEVIAVLPKLIKLNPHVVKEVFNRLWGVTLDTGTSPVSPVDLLVALHLIPPDKCDVKTVIKATALCFSERTIYTAEILAVVLQHLLEQPTLPTLFMRTVIQTLTHHQKLIAFIMNLLQRLITKQIWQHRKAWEGFIKCCERAAPQSFNVLRQLPPAQLMQVFIEAPNLQTKLATHIDSLTDIQRAHIPPSILEVIRAPPTPVEPPPPPPIEGNADALPPPIAAES